MWCRHIDEAAAGLARDGMERAAATVPVGRMGGPDDVAQACLYLCSEAADYVTGANLVVHGGGEPPPFLGAVAGA